MVQTLWRERVEDVERTKGSAAGKVGVEKRTGLEGEREENHGTKNVEQKSQHAKQGGGNGMHAFVIRTGQENGGGRFCK